MSIQLQRMSEDIERGYHKQRRYISERNKKKVFYGEREFESVRALAYFLGTSASTISYHAKRSGFYKGVKIGYIKEEK